MSGGKAVAVEGHDATHKKHILVNNIDKIYEFLIGVPPEERIIGTYKVLVNLSFNALCYRGQQKLGVIMDRRLTFI